jgi:hypothetical protein
MATLGFDLSGVGFSGLSKTWMLQRKYNWQLLLPHNINGNIGLFVSQYCQDVQFGDYGMSALSQLKYGAFQRFYAGIQEIDRVTAVFLAPVDNSVLSYFHGWYNLMVDSEGYFYPKNHYKKSMYVAMYDRSYVESVRFELKGAFPTRKPFVDLSYGDDDVLRYVVEFAVDRIDMTSLIGSIREGVTSVAGDMASKTVELLGGAGGTIGGAVTASGNIITQGGINL